MMNVEFKRGIGAKSGKPYIMLVVTFPNNYQMKIFPSSDAERFMFEQAAAELGI